MLYATHARVHLDNIRENILGIRRAVGARKILIAVKANAYGHGAIEVSRMAEKIGVDFLGVATVPEGIQLRQGGIQLPILKFSPSFPEEMEAALQHDLTLALCSKENVEAMQNVAAKAGKIARVHLKVDTGMGRVGVSMEEAPALARHIEKECPNLHLEGVFTHLPVSDDADTAFTKAQLELFKTTLQAIEKAMERSIEIKHCSNSGAVLAHPEAWLDMVRPGVMIYGTYPDAGTPKTIALKPGMSVLTRISFLKRVEAGTSIGYGRTWIAPEATWIATIPAGYADGFNRLFSNKGRVLINGKSYPIVGRVCMDQSMINLGPETDVQVGETVVLMGKSGSEEISCNEWADKLGTITYEVTCQINGRVERVYEGA